jgi:N-acetylglucosamine kinase-like BadF-type ATPase
MILIADSGSTKTEWLFSYEEEMKIAVTQGLHPLFITEENLTKIIEVELPDNFKQNVSQLFFYGAGCAGKEGQEKIKRVLSKIFPKAKIEVASDLLGAAHACCGNRKGIVAILGTGSSVCQYNGKEIETIRPSLGYILGDEGSGNHIGKKLLNDFFTSKMPTDLFEKFVKKYALTRENVIEAIYKSDFPNRYLASFALFAAEHIDTVYCKKIVKDSIMELFDHHILPLYEKSKLPVSFNGSIAFYFQEILMEICRAKHIQVNKIIQSPGEKLVEYHK